jgi:sulfate-transporting ATPase
MSAQYIFVIKDLVKAYGQNKPVLKNIWLSFYPGAKIGVLGTNGSGKSTLLRIMAGLDKDFTGEAWAANGVKIGYLPQEPVLQGDKTVGENIDLAVSEVRGLLARFEEVNAAFGEPMDDDAMERLLAEQADLQDRIDATGAWDLDRDIDIAMQALRCPPRDALVGPLSGGEKRRVALCQLILSKPDLLLLDEPTNHLDAESVAWLERYLRECAGTVVMITHDRYFLDHVTGWILELDRGEGIPWEGNYSSWLEQKEKRLAQEEKTESERQRQLRHEREWLQSSPKARQAKGKARLNAYETLLQSGPASGAQATAQIVIPHGPRLGDRVVEFEGVTKAFGDRLLFENLSFTLPRSGIVGVIGPNGAGKSTLFKLITGQEKPDSGMIRLGESVVLGYVDQSRDALDNDKTVWEEISGGQDEILLGTQLVKSRAYCAVFNFKGGDQQQLVGNLSGGQRNRVHMARMLRQGANLLLLDEPSNDLDIDTLRALEEALEAFAGCAMITSHDRWFLDRLATHMLAFEGNSHVEWFAGNYYDYEQDRIRRDGPDAMTPKVLRYKPARG